MPLPLVFYAYSTPTVKSDLLRDMFAGSVNCGWLAKDSEGGYVLQWGNTKNEEYAKTLMADVIEKQGNRTVLYYDKPLPRKTGSSIIRLSEEAYQDIIDNAAVWNKADE